MRQTFRHNGRNAIVLSKVELVAPVAVHFANSAAEDLGASSLRHGPEGQVGLEANGHLELPDHDCPRIGSDNKADRTVWSKVSITNDAGRNDGPGLGETLRHDEVVEHSISAGGSFSGVDDPFRDLQPSRAAKLFRCALQSPPSIHEPLNVAIIAEMYCSRSRLNALLCSLLQWR